MVIDRIKLSMRPGHKSFIDELEDAEVIEEESEVDDEGLRAGAPSAVQSLIAVEEKELQAAEQDGTGKGIGKSKPAVSPDPITDPVNFHLPAGGPVGPALRVTIRFPFREQ